MNTRYLNQGFSLLSISAPERFFKNSNFQGGLDVNVFRSVESIRFLIILL